ncbi:CPBP family intramembrane glutamic endopeptidase [Microlunatus ginsengisoli]|uniref:CAAX prenyl protease 2/Lysostaphin resistance protein A-like domain-containing protein n=1 Tax=Microlunatus ginsengisoli TaxID=363863 RepID=A0ABP7AID1_9ACTN
MRISPRPWLGLAAFVGYIAVILGVQGTSGIPYPELADTAHNIWRSGVLSIVLASLLMAVLATWWGWWRPALFERPPTTRRWTIIAPVLMALLASTNLLLTDWGGVGWGFVLAGIALGLAVGFGEEFTARGLLLVGLRGRLREVMVWVLTCSMFGLMHGINIILGAPAGDTVVQIISAAMSGSVFYILRRVTGTLIWAMALHGLWDFSLFVLAASGSSNAFTILQLPFGLLAVIFGFFATKDAPSGLTVQGGR